MMLKLILVGLLAVSTQGCALGRLFTSSSAQIAAAELACLESLGADVLNDLKASLAGIELPGDLTPDQIKMAAEADLAILKAAIKMELDKLKGQYVEQEIICAAGALAFGLTASPGPSPMGSPVRLEQAAARHNNALVQQDAQLKAAKVQALARLLLQQR